MNNIINNIKTRYIDLLFLLKIHNTFIINIIKFIINSNLSLLHKKVFLNKIINKYITYSNMYYIIYIVKFNNLDIYISLFINNGTYKNHRYYKHKLYININDYLLTNNYLKNNDLYMSIYNNTINYNMEDIYNIFIKDIIKCISKSSLSLLYKKIFFINYLSKYINNNNKKLIYDCIKNNDNKLYEIISNKYEIFRYNYRRKDYLKHIQKNLIRSRNYYKNNKISINKKRNKYKNK